MQSPDVYEAVRKLNLSRSALFHTLRFLDNADSNTTAWIKYLLGGTSEDDDKKKKKKKKHQPAVKPLSITEKVDKYLGMLEHPWPKYKQLFGWRIEPDQVTDTPISSGKKDFDDKSKITSAYQAAENRAQELGFVGPGENFELTGHIEIMEASTMKPGEKRIIVIGKRPCGWEYDRNRTETLHCHQVLDRFLPPGATLVVYAWGSNGRKYSRYTYKGRNT